MLYKKNTVHVHSNMIAFIAVPTKTFVATHLHDVIHTIEVYGNMCYSLATLKISVTTDFPMEGHIKSMYIPNA